VSSCRVANIIAGDQFDKSAGADKLQDVVVAALFAENDICGSEHRSRARRFVVGTRTNQLYRGSVVRPMVQRT
jgi:hypothetical protein